jgi:hypothetical protein
VPDDLTASDAGSHRWLAVGVERIARTSGLGVLGPASLEAASASRSEQVAA